MKKKKILFIENKTGVFYWDKISKYLLKNYEIHWIIQNHIYLPKEGIHHKIKYPKKNDLRPIKNNDDFKKIYSADRGHLHYGQSTNHYHYYYKEIKKIITKTKPSLIIGEATLFHELITIKIAKELKIRYIFPTGTRHPSDRTEFNRYDKQSWIMNQNKDETVDDIKIAKLINLISEGKHKPFYMKQISLLFNLKFLVFKFLALMGYFFGDKYNTHSPLLYIKSFIQKKFIYYLWKFYSIRNKKILHNLFKKKTLLYPMQMQPESNINVWGYPYADQIKIIKELSFRLKKIGFFLAVKPNPKLKYEINYKTFFEIKKLSNVILIHPKTEMNYLLKKCNAVFSITGTVILECVILNKNIYTLINSDYTNHRGIIIIKSLKYLVSKLKNLKNKKVKKDNTNAMLMFKKIIKYSFPYPFNLWHNQPSNENPDPLIAKSIIQIEKNEKF